MSKLKKIIKKSVLVQLSQTIGIIIRFFLIALFARYLGAGLLGNYRFSNIVISIFSRFSNAGTSTGLLRLGSILVGKEDIYSYKKLINYTFTISSVLSLIALVFLYVFSDFIAVEFFNNYQLAVFIKYSCFGVLVLNIQYNIFTHFQILGKANYATILANVYSPLILILSFALLLFANFQKLDLILYTLALSYFIYFILLFYNVRNQKIRFHIDLSKNLKKDLFSTSFPMLFSEMLTNGQRWLDTFLLGAFASSELVGLYFVGVRISNFIVMPRIAINRVFLPEAGKLLGQNNFEEVDALYKSVTRLMLFLGLTIFIPIFFLRAPILEIFGDEFKDAADIILPIMIGQLINIGTGATGRLITICGGAKLNLLDSVLTVVFIIVSGIILIPRFEILGAAISFGIGMLISNGLQVIQLKKYYNLTPFDKKYLMLIISFLTIVVLFNYMQFNPYAKTLVSLLGFVFFNVKFIMDIEERKIFTKMFAKKFAK